MTTTQADPSAPLRGAIHAILTIVGHSGEEIERYTNMLVNTIIIKALLYILSAQENNGGELETKLISLKDSPQDALRLLLTHTDQIHLEHALRQASHDVMTTYFEYIKPSFTSKQYHDMVSYKQTLTSHIHTAYG